MCLVTDGLNLFPSKQICMMKIRNLLTDKANIQHTHCLQNTILLIKKTNWLKIFHEVC